MHAWKSNTLLCLLSSFFHTRTQLCGSIYSLYYYVGHERETMTLGLSIAFHCLIYVTFSCGCAGSLLVTVSMSVIILLRDDLVNLTIILKC